jgi:hypothetical protein
VLEGIPISLDVLAPSALLGLCVLLIFMGKLVPRSQVKALITEYERQITDIAHDRDEWRAAHRISEQGRVEEREHAVTLTNEIARPLTGFLQGFRQATDVPNEEAQ